MMNYDDDALTDEQLEENYGCWSGVFRAPGETLEIWTWNRSAEGWDIEGPNSETPHFQRQGPRKSNRVRYTFPNEGMRD